MIGGDMHDDRRSVVFVAEPAAESSPVASRRLRRDWVVVLVLAALAAIAVIVWRHSAGAGQRPPAAAASTPVVSPLCPTTCEASNGTAHMRAVITAAIEDAFDRATQVRVNTLTSTVVPGTERTLLRRYVTARVPAGSLTVVVSTSPTGGSPFGEAPATTTLASATAVLDDYYVSATLQYPPGATQPIDVGLRQLVHDARLVEQR